MTRETKEMTEETKTLVLEMNGNKDRKVVIPHDWTITFGPIGVGARHDGQNSTHVLRLYEDAGKKKLKAVFRNIVAFHEEGIQILEKVVRKKNKTFRKAGSKGEQTYSAEVRQTTWSNPYEDEPEVPEDEFEVSEDALQIQAFEGNGPEF